MTRPTTIALSSLAFALVTGLAACEAADPRDSASNNLRELDAVLERMDVRLGEEQRSISNFTVNGFRAIDENSLIVTSGVDDHYLINLTTPCLGLPYAFSMAFQSRTNNITSFDNIVVNDLTGRPEVCQISRIYRLEETGAGDPVVR